MMRVDRMAWCRLVPAALLGLGAALSTAAPQEAKKQDLDPEHAAKMAKGLAIFKQHVRPILEQSCLRCHGGKTIESELDLSERDGLLKGGQHGPVVVLGKSQDSPLVKLIMHQREPHMPKVGAKLPDAAVAHIKSWIDLGAPYDGTLVAGRVKKQSWTERVLPVGAGARAPGRGAAVLVVRAAGQGDAAGRRGRGVVQDRGRSLHLRETAG